MEGASLSLTNSILPSLLGPMGIDPGDCFIYGLVVNSSDGQQSLSSLGLVVVMSLRSGD